MDFQGAVSGFCLPIGGYLGSCLRFSRQIAGLSSFEKLKQLLILDWIPTEGEGFHILRMQG